jgi:hypothetical protein
MNALTKILAAFALCFALQACASTEPATCSQCPGGGVVCTGTIQACIEDGGGTCKTGGPGDLGLNADGSFNQEFGAYAQTGTWTEVSNELQLTAPDGTVVGNVSFAENAVCRN